jgi:hypothetical protein
MELHCQFKNITIVLFSNDYKFIQIGETFQALTRFSEYKINLSAIAGYPYFNTRWMKGIKSSIRSRESDGYGSKESKLVSLILKNEAISNLKKRIETLNFYLSIR